MKEFQRLEIIFLALAALGTMLPLAAFLPWLATHGLDVPLFLDELFANRIAAFFGLDVIVSAVVVLAATVAARARLSGLQICGVVAGTLLIGVSLGLPLLLLFLERARGTTMR